MGKRICLLLSVFVLIVSIGTYGLIQIEGWKTLDALYFTIITLTTIGYGEIHPLSDQGRIFTLFIVFLGVGNTAYIFSLIFQYILEMKFLNKYGIKKMEKKLKMIHDHTIICGFGNMGEMISDQLANQEKGFVIIDKDPTKANSFKEKGYLFLTGNASDDDALKKAGIERAKTLVCVVTNDAENVFITLTARTLNKDIKIITRVFDESTRPKLIKAGANKVISPYTQASHKITQSIINPAIDDFLEFVSNDDKIEYQLADIFISQNMSCADKKLNEIQIKENGLVIVGIKKKNGKMILAPESDEKISHGDRILAIGKPENFSEIIGNLTRPE